MHGKHPDSAIIAILSFSDFVAVLDNVYGFLGCFDFADLAFPILKKLPLRGRESLIRFRLFGVFDFKEPVPGVSSDEQIDRRVQPVNGTSDGLKGGNNLFFIFIAPRCVSFQGHPVFSNESVNTSSKSGESSRNSNHIF
jgi:hypothetical protein